MIKYGICVNNKDPYDLNRIRLVINDGIEEYRNFNDITKLVSLNDSSGRYIPWELDTTNNKRDIYLCEPFNPDTLVSRIPDIGQLVKVIDVGNNIYEYIGAVTNDFNNKNQPYNIAKKNPLKSNNKNKGLKPKESDLVLSKNNSQIIMSDKEIINRVNYNTNNIKNLHPFESLSFIDNSYSLTNEFTDELVENVRPIDYICIYKTNINFSSNDLYTLIFEIYDAKSIKNNTNGLLGILTSDFENSPYFIDEITNNTPIYTLNVKTSNINKLVTSFKTIINDIKKSNIPYTEEINQNDLKITNVSNLNSNDLILNGINIVYFLLHYTQDKLTTIPDAILRTKDLNLDGSNYNILSTNLFKPLTVYDKTPQSLRFRKVKKEIKKNIPSESYKVINVDNLYVNTTKNTTDLSTLSTDTTSFDYDTLIAKFKNSYSTIRGEELIKIIILIIETLLKHGHVAGVDPRISIIDESKSELTVILDKLKKELNDNQNNIILNKAFKLS